MHKTTPQMYGIHIHMNYSKNLSEFLYLIRKIVIKERKNFDGFLCVFIYY